MILRYLILILFATPVVAADFQVTEKQLGPAKISFVKNVSAEKDEKGEEKYFNSKASFSTIEKLAPLNKAALATVTAEHLKNLTAEEFNQLYARLQSGPMLSGDFKGAILQKSPLFISVKKKLLKSLHLQGPLAAAVTTLCGQNEDCLFETIWKGKRFLPKNNLGQIEGLTLIQLPLGSITLFPMNTYCGISQVDTRRESQITDGNFSDDFADYIPLRDEIISRKNLSITEEYRMLRPGLYIGKVYSNKIFLFNVALEKTTSTLTSTESASACFDGSKTR